MANIFPTTVAGWTALVDLASKIALLLGGVVAGIWAYIKFVLEKGLLPPVEFDVACTPASVLSSQRVVEILLQLKNVGNSTLICSNLRLDVRYLRESDDRVALECDRDDKLFGRMIYPRSLIKNDLRVTDPIMVPPKPHGIWRRWISLPAGTVIKFLRRAQAWCQSAFYTPPKPDNQRPPRGLPVLRYDTFVQPGVNQTYSVTTLLPETASHVLIWASFQYGVRPSPLQKAILRLGRVLGLIQYSLTHVRIPHIAEHSFDLRPTSHTRPNSPVDPRAAIEQISRHDNVSR